MRAQGVGMAEIAFQLGRHRSTLYREVARNRSAYDGAYRASAAIEQTNARRSRSRRNARYGPADYAPVEQRLRQEWSPAQIVGRRRREGLPVMSHETIYLYIWKDRERGGSLWQPLRGSRKQRRKRYGRNDSRGRLAGKKMTSERPAVVAGRTRFGDWELDTVHGQGKACVLTAVERKSGLIRIGKLTRATAQQTTRRTVQLLKDEPHPVLTLTPDNGSEFHGYKEIECRLNTHVFFATPHHAWERGTNENTNGLLRQYLPKGKNLEQLTQRQCERLAAKLNHRPRLRLGFQTPHEVYHAAVPALRH